MLLEFFRKNLDKQDLDKKICSFALYNQLIFYIRLGYHNSVRRYINNIIDEFL